MAGTTTITTSPSPSSPFPEPSQEVAPLMATVAISSLKDSDSETIQIHSAKLTTQFMSQPLSPGDRSDAQCLKRREETYSLAMWIYLFQPMAMIGTTSLVVSNIILSRLLKISIQSRDLVLVLASLTSMEADSEMITTL